MARLTPITNKSQVAAKDQAIVDAIVKSRGAVQGPFTMFLHCPELAERVAHLGAFVRFEGSLDMRVRVLAAMRSEEHTSELQSHSDLVCRLLLEKKNEVLAARSGERRYFQH